MQQLPPAFLEERTRRYIRELTAGETPAMERVRAESDREGHPSITPETGRVLQCLAVAAGARRVLEVGCCIGYSTLWLAEVVGPDGVVDTIEFDPDMAREARANFEEAGVADRVRILEGPALDVLPALEGPFDLVFLDADKREYVDYLEHALRITRPRSIIAADNLLWQGRVMDPTHEDDNTNGIRRYTKAILANDNLVSTLLPVGDGLGVSVVLP